MTLYPGLQESIDQLDRQVSQQVQQHPPARRLMTHPGVGPITALATEVFLGDPLRFSDGKALASYIGMIPSEHSSGGRQRLGAMSKQGNTLLRYHDPESDPQFSSCGDSRFPQPFLHQFASVSNLRARFVSLRLFLGE
jgi:transposase